MPLEKHFKWSYNRLYTDVIACHFKPRAKDRLGLINQYILPQIIRRSKNV